MGTGRCPSHGNTPSFTEKCEHVAPLCCLAVQISTFVIGLSQSCENLLHVVKINPQYRHKFFIYHVGAVSFEDYLLSLK